MRKKKQEPSQHPKISSRKLSVDNITFSFISKNVHKNLEKHGVFIVFCVHFCFGQRMCQRLPLSFMQHLAASEAPAKEGQKMYPIGCMYGIFSLHE